MDLRLLPAPSGSRQPLDDRVPDAPPGSASALPARRTGPATGPRPAGAGRRAGVVVALAALLAGCTSTAEPGVSPAPTDTGTAAASPTPTPTPTGDVVPPPDEHSALGDLPEGFPEQLLPLPEDAEVLVSTYAPVDEAGVGQPYEVSLNLRTSLPVADVAALYRTTLTAAGFTETAGTPTQGLAAQSTYSRSSGAELLTVAVLDEDDQRTLTVGGTLRAAE